jgi:predicted TPR repeat methyltransferase
MPNPLLNPAVALTPVEGGYLAWDADLERLHQLNATGALIAELCDGSRSEAEIRRLVCPLLPNGEVGENGQWVDRWLEEGVEAGLLVWRDGERVRPRHLSTEELADLAQHLIDHGNLKIAQVCAMRVTELTPEDPGAWHRLGVIGQLTGQRELARRGYENYLAYAPEDAGIRHQLTALRDEAPPPRASDECILQTFREFSNYYDTKMREQLTYQAPERLLELIQSEIGDATKLEILDIGCGTGLMGAGLRGQAAHLAGIDLSTEMLEVARERGIYDTLEVAEITAWLEESTVLFDLIVACDCLVYFGDLEPVTRLAAARLKAGAWYAFTAEQGQKYPLHLSDSGRFTHHPDHIRESAAVCGLRVARMEEGFLRMEAGAEVTGLFVLLAKPGEV